MQKIDSWQSSLWKDYYFTSYLELAADNFVRFFGSSRKIILILHCKLRGGSQRKEILMRRLSFSIFIVSSCLAQASKMGSHYHVLLLTECCVKLSGDFCPLTNKMPTVWFETHLWNSFQSGNAAIKYFAKSDDLHFLLENVKMSPISKAAGLLDFLNDCFL